MVGFAAGHVVCSFPQRLVPVHQSLKAEDVSEAGAEGDKRGFVVHVGVGQFEDVEYVGVGEVAGVGVGVEDGRDAGASFIIFR